MTSRNQPITLPARRTTSAPSVAYSTGEGAWVRLPAVSEVFRWPHAMTVSTAPASDSAVTRTHAAAVARRTRVTRTLLRLAPPRPEVQVGRDAEDEQPVEGVQRAKDCMILGEPGEQ